jgi:hypothetical protein
VKYLQIITHFISLCRVFNNYIELSIRVYATGRILYIFDKMKIENTTTSKHFRNPIEKSHKQRRNHYLYNIYNTEGELAKFIHSCFQMEP